MACAEPAGRTLRVVSLPGLPHSSLNWSVGRKAIAQEVRSNSCDLYAGSMSPAFAMNSVKSIRDSSHLATITLRLQTKKRVCTLGTNEVATRALETCLSIFTPSSQLERARALDA